ncbi:sir2 family domain-containing protein [Purpureocillium lavendulum]|uniref:Sir2 family domain-containing protein n=1 Tax=Purpureocillium lavendulum TaxID=1247861 RepID=A0AB34FB07_9HYPO|nr:sir2 family domain-containing protein [Purpureocillium lavendulum]
MHQTIHGPSDEDCLQSVADCLERAKKVVVLMAAGVSTAAHIPDFRSNMGLYKNGEVFSESATRSLEGRTRLLQLALELRRQACISRPTQTHRLVDALRIRGQLLRCYTQNIDMLEERAGLSVGIDPDHDCIPLHGSLRYLRCPSCCGRFDWASYETRIEAGDDLSCPDCYAACQKRMDAGKRRSHVGLLMPDIALLDEAHQDGEAIGSIIANDVAAAPDLLLVLGTSLRVPGPKQLASTFARVVSVHGGTVIYVDLSKRCATANQLDSQSQASDGMKIDSEKEKTSPTFAATTNATAADGADMISELLRKRLARKPNDYDAPGCAA